MLPFHRKRLHHFCPSQSSRLSASRYRLHDLRRQQRHTEQAAEIGRVDVFPISDLLDGLAVAFPQHLLPGEPSCQSFQESVVRPRARGAGAPDVPSGVKISLRPPRLRIANGTVSEMVCSVMLRHFDSYLPS